MKRKLLLLTLVSFFIITLFSCDLRSRDELVEEMFSNYIIPNDFPLFKLIDYSRKPLRNRFYHTKELSLYRATNRRFSRVIRTKKNRFSCFHCRDTSWEQDFPLDSIDQIVWTNRFHYKPNVLNSEDNYYFLDSIYSCTNAVNFVFTGYKNEREKSSYKYDKFFAEFDISKLPNLKYLELYGTIPERIYKQIKNCKKLKELYISKCDLITEDGKTVPIDKLEIPSSNTLTRVLIDNTIIQEIPEEIGNNELEYFSLTCVRNDTWENHKPCTLKGSEHLFKCTSLKELEVYGFEIPEIPDGITEFDQLEYLNLSNTNTTKISSNENGLDNLKSLLFYGMNLGEIPNFVYKSEKIEDLFLDKCGVEEVKSFEEMKQLNTVRLSHNPINDNSQFIFSNVDYLSLHHCGLNELPRFIIKEQRQKTTKIDLNFNNITKVEHDCFGFLSSLSVDYNNIQSVPELICCSNLTRISLRGNPLFAHDSEVSCYSREYETSLIRYFSSNFVDSLSMLEFASKFTNSSKEYGSTGLHFYNQAPPNEFLRLYELNTDAYRRGVLSHLKKAGREFHKQKILNLKK